MGFINTFDKKKHLNNKLSKCDNKILNSSKSCQLEISLKSKAFYAGVDVDGQPLFVCRVNQFNEQIPGKLSANVNKCSITYHKKEYHFKRYHLLVESEFRSYKWTQVKRPAKKLPENIVLGGSDLKGHFYYISQCRVRTQNIKFISHQIGKVYWNNSISEWIATVPFSGQEIECFDYSVLIIM